MRRDYLTIVVGLAMFLLPALYSPAFSQQSKIDSLSARLKKNINDTDRVNTLNALAGEYRSSKPDTSFLHTDKAIALAEKIGFKNGLTDALRNKGTFNLDKGNYPHALKYYLESLKLSEELKDKTGIAKTLGNIGSVFNRQADYPKALEYYFKALKIDEELGNKNGITRHLGNIGNIYGQQANYPKALEYYFRALRMNEKLGANNFIAINLANIGIVYMYQADYPKALEYFLRALTLKEELGDKRGIAINLGNIGSLCTKTGKFKEAEEYLHKALALSTEIYALNYQKEVEQSLSILYDTLSLVAADSGQWTKKAEYSKLAFDHYKKYITLRDSINSEENQKKQVRTEMNFEFEKREALSKAEYEKQIALSEANKRTQLAEAEKQKAIIESEKTAAIAEADRKKTIAEMEKKKALIESEKKIAAAKSEQEKERAVAEEKDRKQKIVIYSVISGLLLVVFFAAFIFRSLRVTRKQKHIIELARDEIAGQKKLVEEHQKEIIDSITYSQRIQRAILAREEDIKKSFPESFLLYRPKDIVAGDFYFFEVLPAATAGCQLVFVAACDCTGHGVPGALMSVVCSNALSRCVKEFGLTAPGEILDKARELVLDTLRKSGEDVKDGMDISLLKVEYSLFPDGSRKASNLQWAGANNPLWYIRKNGNGTNELVEIKPDKQPIGKSENPSPFTTHTIEFSPIPNGEGSGAALSLSKGEGTGLFYLFTDGYADQFGGPKGKKFKYKQMQEKLMELSPLSLHKQKEILEKTFDHWKDDLEQIDDVLVMGIKV